jgi:SAM-dependent methyltransferase
MRLREGIPTLAEVDALVASPTFLAHRAFSDAFRARHAPLLRRYGRWWGSDPLSHWSRRWEYPFAAQRIFDFCVERSSRALRLLDAGSGVTYLPFFLCSRASHLSILCCDINAAYGQVVASIAHQLNMPQITFRRGALQRLPESDGAVDVLSCISVLEHTSDYAAIIDEFARVLSPGGLLVLTFDVSFDGKFPIQPDRARALLKNLQRKFDIAPLSQPLEESTEVLTTDHCRRHAPHLLPFTHPWLLAGYDMLRGKGWTRGFRSAAVVCVAGLLRPSGVAVEAPLYAR